MGNMAESGKYARGTRGMLATLWGLLALMLAGAPAWAAGNWFSDWTKATGAAKQDGKALVAVFSSAGCPECAKMESAMSDRKAQSALGKAVKVRLEFSEHRDLASRFGVTATPTLLVFSPDTGFSSYVYREDGVMRVGEIVALGRTMNLVGPASGDGKESAGRQLAQTGAEAMKKRSAKRREQCPATPAIAAGNGAYSQPSYYHSYYDAYYGQNGGSGYGNSGYAYGASPSSGSRQAAKSSAQQRNAQSSAAASSASSWTSTNQAGAPGSGTGYDYGYYSYEGGYPSGHTYYYY